ncbi:uncharacterized protein [Eurosta solidaginis]|uniref:uncharacterized protein n=1 Tax=Eurosta solidaginis TaxID=178769 RepID=UPI00353103E3
MKTLHITFILCCLCYCVHSNSNAQNVHQPTKWKPISTTTTTTPAPVSQYSRQARRSQQTLQEENGNEANPTLPLLGKTTDDVEDVEKEDNDKHFDHKQRVLLAVESNLKYHGRAKQQEKLKTSVLQQEVPDSRKRLKDVPDSRKRLKDGLKDLLSQLQPDQPSSDSMLQKSAPINEILSRPSKPRKSVTNIPKKQQRRTYIKTLKCEDIPHSEALLHSGLLNNLKNWQATTQNPMLAQTLENVRETYEMQRNRLKPRRNQLQFFPAYHSYQPVAWSPNPSMLNRFNYYNPYNSFDCNYFLDPVSEAVAPTVQYIFDDDDYDGDQSVNSFNAVDFLNDNKLEAKK